MRSNYDQPMKHERQLIHIADRKRTREAISSDSSNYQQLNKRKRQSIKVKEEQIEIEMQTSKEIQVKTETSIAFLNKETTISSDIHSNSSNTKTNRIPTDKRRFKCNTCNKSFTSTCNLEIHRRTHTGERPFECEICKKSFINSCNLEIHRRTH